MTVSQSRRVSESNSYVIVNQIHDRLTARRVSESNAYVIGDQIHDSLTLQESLRVEFLSKRALIRDGLTV